jgi:hypothetical protein
MSKAGPESAELAVSFVVCSPAIGCQAVDGSSNAVQEVLGSVHEVVEEVATDVMDALGDGACGHRDSVNTLCHMSAVTGHGGGAKRPPDEPFGDVGLSGVEGAQVGVRFPLFEQQLDLPA